jgi:hypothetical protein
MKRQDSTARIFNPRCCNVRTHSRWTPGSPGPPSQEGRHSAGKDVRRYVMRMPPGSTYSGHKCREETIRRCKESALNSALLPRLFKLNYGNGSGSKSQENRSDRTGTVGTAPTQRARSESGPSGGATQRSRPSKIRKRPGELRTSRTSMLSRIDHCSSEPRPPSSSMPIMPTMRSRSSTVANSIVILPLLRPISTLTRVSNLSESRPARSSSAGA